MDNGCWFLWQAEDGIRDLVRSRGMGDGYKRQTLRAQDVSGGDGVYRAGGRGGGYHNEWGNSESLRDGSQWRRGGKGNGGGRTAGDKG